MARNSLAMGRREAEPRTLGRGKLLAIIVLTALAVVLVAVALPENLRWIALVFAFAAGIGLERFRHSFFNSPPSLRETPETWRYLLRYEVGWWQIGIATVLLAGAAAILLVSFDSTDAPVPTDSAPAPSAGPQPALERRTEDSSGFVANGVRFEVSESNVATAAEVAGPGERAVGVTVRVENKNRRGLNPAVLDYRLSDSTGALFAPERAAAVGSDALVATGSLPKGDRVDQELVFAVPKDARKLALEFEPVLNGPETIRVPLPG
jgi:hypothetical protein